MLDFTGDMQPYQDQLDRAGVDFDITNLAGATKEEIESMVSFMINRKKSKAVVSNANHKKFQ